MNARLAIILVMCLTLTSHALGEEAKPEKKLVKKQLVLAAGSTIRLQMTSKKPIKFVFNENDNVVFVQPAPNDPTAVLITARVPGRTRIILRDFEGKEEGHVLGK